MKCPECQRNQKRGREGMTCKSCSYTFLFDPKADALSGTQNLHDSLFRKIINHASASGSYHFTTNQLYSSARHFLKNGVIGLLFALIVFLIPTYIMGSQGFVPGLIISGIVSLIILAILVQRLYGSYGISRSKWDGFVKRWVSHNKEIPNLIRSPALVNPPETWAENDIYDYGVSGIIFCNRPELVDWLVLNNFHAQSNQLILTPSGYPTYLAPHAQKLLVENSEIPVRLLHDPASTYQQMLNESIFPFKTAEDLGVDAQSITKLRSIRARFSGQPATDIALDNIPYKTLSAALSYCLANGINLSSALASDAFGADTDISFG